MRELKNLARVIRSAKEFGATEEEAVNLVSEIKMTWSWGRPESQTAEKATRETKWEN